MLDQFTEQEISPAVRMGCRFMAYRDFAETVVHPPAFLSWHFLFLHQLVFEEVAVKFPDKCGFKKGASTQNIRQEVNQDLKRLSRASCGPQAASRA